MNHEKKNVMPAGENLQMQRLFLIEINAIYKISRYKYDKLLCTHQYKTHMIRDFVNLAMAYESN